MGSHTHIHLFEDGPTVRIIEYPSMIYLTMGLI